jgi:hypothetical protein
VGTRLAFDAEAGAGSGSSAWACDRWNLSPLDERWEAIEDCERRFRSTRIRFSTDNVGLAYLSEGLALIRIGPALKPEIAAWRLREAPGPLAAGGAAGPISPDRQAMGRPREAAMDYTFRRVFGVHLGYDLATWLRVAWPGRPDAGGDAGRRRTDGGDSRPRPRPHRAGRPDPRSRGAWK